MTHTHEDRVADRPAHLCAAYGCPLIGSMCSSTSGSTEWWCFAHFGATPGQFQAITSEMHRLRWLAMAVHDVRYHDKPGTEASRAAFQLIERELKAHGREDLLWIRPDGQHQGEKRYRWLERLEAALKASLDGAGVLNPSSYQAALPIGGGDKSSFSKVGFDMPM
ncbi:MAG TPA: hypothetical protein DCX52_13980 [Massilia sp.]|nr:hypothetical protein [Massilia sp.]